MENNNLDSINGQQQEKAAASPEDNQASADKQFLDADFFLLIFILLIFFQRPNVFSEKFKLLNRQVQTIKEYLDTADATLQALKQATQIPNQKLNQ